MGFLNELLGRPRHEKPFLLLVVGHPVDDAVVPDIARKPLAEISSLRAGKQKTPGTHTVFPALCLSRFRFS
jgi:hypothetical protein